MPIQSLELENVGPFRFHAAAVPGMNDFKVHIKFDNDVNLLIGPNNVGKSTILQAVNLLTEGWTESFIERYLQPGGFPREANSATVAMEWDDGQHQSLRFESDYGNLSRMMHSIRNTVAQDRQGDAFRIEMGLGSAHRSPITARLANEQVGLIKYLGSETPPENCPYARWENHKGNDFGYVGYATHNSYTLENPENLNAYAQGGGPFERDVYLTILRIVAQIMSGFPIQPSPNGGFIERNRVMIAFQTPDGQVPFSDLSLGTRYALSWVMQFIDSFAQRYKGHDDWRKGAGILIIDEVDAHLHPSWQRRIIPTLKEYFPNVQIFASTHSPMMVAGLKAGQVHLLNRDSTGTVTWSRNEQDIIGWTADEIYRTFMGIDDPTDELTVRRANRLRELRDKEVRTEAEGEEMNTLRRQVNENLLAKSPVGAQSERYAELMQRFLLALESDLSQDGA